MSTAAPSPLQDLNSPLPAEVAGSGHGWLTHYRAFPVFSARWGIERLRLFGGCVLLGLLAAVVGLWNNSGTESMPWGGLLQLAVQLLLPLFAGPLLGAWVRRQGWPPAREGAALCAAVGAVVGAVLVFHLVGAEPLKQWLAERTGQVDEKGQRKRLVMGIGLTVMTPDPPERGPADVRSLPDMPDGEPGPRTRATTTATFTLLALWLAGGAALWGWRRERQGLLNLARERELARAQADRREAELRLSVLAAQVEPHFLFNTLAGVRSAISTDPARASDMIGHLVDYLRAAIPRLRSSGGSDTTLGGQLDIVRAYLALMSARMPRLACTVEAAPELLGLPCPPLMLISLAENAVKHGVEPKMGPAHVSVHARRDEQGALEITVADDGAGFGASAAGSGLGLSNIRERLQQMYRGRAALTLKARAQGGVAATLTLPID